MPLTPTPKRVFAGNEQGKRICGYKLVGYQPIEKEGHTILQEIREPLLEGEGKYQHLQLPERFLQHFMVDEDKIPPTLKSIPAPGSPEHLEEKNRP